MAIIAGSTAGNRTATEESCAVISRHRKGIHHLFYWGPLVVALGCALFLATSHGDYDTSLRDLYAFFAFFGPEYPRPDVGTMYGVNGIARQLAYLVQYGFLSILFVRALQGGAARLRRRSIAGTLLCGIGFVLVDNTVRNRTPGRHGGWDDVTLSAIGVALTTAIIYIFFVVKHWERSFATDIS